MFSKAMTDTLIEQLSSLGEVTDINDLLQKTADMIQFQNAEIVGVNIYLVDSNKEFANMIAGTGKAARLLLRRGSRHKIEPLNPSYPTLGGAIYDNKIQSIDYRSSFASPSIGWIDIAFPLQCKDDVIGAIEISIGALNKALNRYIDLEVAQEFFRFTNLVAQRICEMQQSE
jgi:hypothetical protein